MSMNDPYPSDAILRAEAAADLLIVEHDAAVQAFRDAVVKCLATIAPLTYPLGSPSRDYDIADIESTMEAWLVPHTSEKTEAEAWDIALQREEAI